MSILLTWDDANPGEDGFRVYRSESTIDPQALPAALTTLPPDSTEYLDETVVGGTTYFYRVSTYKGALEAVSGEVSIEAASSGGPAPIARYTAAGVDSTDWIDEIGAYDLVFAATPSIVDVAGEDAVRFNGSTIYAHSTAAGFTVRGFRIRAYFPNGISNATPGFLIDVSDWVSPEWQSYIAIGESSGYMANETVAVCDGQGFYDYGRTYSTSTFSAGIYDLEFSFNAATSLWDIYVNGTLQTVYATTPSSRGDHTRALPASQLCIGSFGSPYLGTSLLEADVISIEIYDEALF